MKKGRKYHSLGNKFFTVFHSGFLTSVIGFIALSIISLGSVAVDIAAICLNDGELAKNIVSLVVSSLSSVFSVFGAVKSIIALVVSCFHRQFLNTTDYKTQVQNAVVGNYTQEYIKSNYEWGCFKNQYYLHSNAVNRALQENADRLLLQVSKKMQKSTSEQQQAIYKLVKDKIAQGKNIFNSNLVRLRTDLLLDGVFSQDNNLDNINKIDDDDNGIRFKDFNFVKVDRTCYFYNMTTNDLIYSRIFKSDYLSVYSFKDMIMDSDDTLFNLSQSPAANIIGVTTIAITNDGYLVVNKQSNNNDVNNKSYVPSGSGSSDFADLAECSKLKSQMFTQLESQLKAIEKEYSTIDLDGITEKIVNFSGDDITKFNKEVENYKYKSELLKDKKTIESYLKKIRKYTCSFSTFIKYGMVRELIEESHIYANEIKKCSTEAINNLILNTDIYGYIRILDRGGKPDFFGITFLDLGINEVKVAFNNGRKNVTQTELKKKCTITDFNEVSQQVYIKLGDLFKCKSSEEFFVLLKNNDTNNSQGDEISMSLQLYYLFQLIKDNKDKILNKFDCTPDGYRKKRILINF